MFSEEVVKFIELCQWDTTNFLIISENVFGPLIYYSHLLPLVCSLLLGGFIFFKNKKNISARWLFITNILLAIWLFSDLILWASEKPSYIMFFWSLTVLVEPLIYVGILFFTYAIIKNQDISFNKKTILFVIILPTVLLMSTQFALLNFDLSNCEREAIEGPLALYGYFIEIIISLWIFIFGVKEFIKTKILEEKRKVVLIIFGIAFFLLSFSAGNIIGSFSLDWTIGQYGLFGIPVFVSLLSYLIVKYKAFNIKLIGVQALVTAIWIILLSILFIRTIENVRVIVFLTLSLFTIMGILLVRSVKKEVRQREEGGVMAEKLYEQNLELAIKNKTLSLLEKLYQASVLNLTPEEMAKEITDAICKNLNLELTGVLIFNKESDSLMPLSFSKSERFTKNLDKLKFLFSEIKIKDISNHNLFKQVVYNQEDSITNSIEKVWTDLVKQEYLKEIKIKSHIKTILLYPLIIDKGVFGVLLLGLNRNYDTLSTFEKASIRSFINVIVLLLDKSYLYKNLQIAYEVEKKANEELEELDKVKNQFLTTTQHDLRTPLTAISGYSDLLISGTFGKQPKKIIEVIKKIREVSQNMKKRADSFLDVAQFKLGKGSFALKPGIEVNSILNEIVDELKFKSDQRGIYLKLDPPQPVSPKGDGVGAKNVKDKFTISADREKLKSAIFNVVDNSIKYTEKGGVTVKISLNQQGLPKADSQFLISNNENKNLTPNTQNLTPKILITIQDTGIGVSAEKVKTLFDTQFERSEQAKKTAEGKGVGLYLSAQIIKYHNGRIWVESLGEGQGSTFYIELPITMEKPQ